MKHSCHGKLYGVLLLFLLCSSTVLAEDTVSGIQKQVEMEEELDLDQIENTLDEMSELSSFSFLDTVRDLLDGTIPLKPDQLLRSIGARFLNEVTQYRSLVFRILAIALISSVFTNFVKVFENSQIAEISFYMMYLLIAALLIRFFFSMRLLTEQSLQSVIRFMNVLLPSYLLTVVFSAGSVSALGFYEATLVMIYLLQMVIIKLILPLIQMYLILLLLNEMTQEDYFSKLAELMESIARWSSKTVLGIAIGLQTVQCLVSPAVDSLKNSAAHRLIKAIPGIGGALGAATETVAGSAVVIKNAVGTAGILSIAALCLIPVLKLLACTVVFRLLCALLQPVCEKRMIECVESISRGAVLLLRVLLSGMAVFIISIAMVTASVR